jgi:predicted nuclease of restriction endonuclease-like (RecB) superfamily
MTKPAERQQEALFRRVAEIIEDARGDVARTVNAAMVQAYWLIGREIVEVDQEGKARARYGDRLVRQLAVRLSERHGKGFSYSSIKRMKQFYLTFPHGSTIPAGVSGIQKGSAPLGLLAPGRDTLFPPALGWTHYQILVRVDDPDARSFYEIEAAREFWWSRELERQIASRLFERLAKSRDKARVLALAKKGNEAIVASDVIKDPFVLEFLDLPERHTWLERDLEQAIIDRIEGSLLELGKEFCFAARQKRRTLDGDHFYVDLVFYNRLLRCFVLVDLKLGKLTHQDLGQMQMYASSFDRSQPAEHEAGKDHRHRLVLREERRDGEDHAARGRRARARGPLPDVPADGGGTASRTHPRTQGGGGRGPTGGSDTKGQRPSRVGGTCTMTSCRYGGQDPNHASR